MDYARRLQHTRTTMARGGIDLLAIPPGDDLRYLAGFSTVADERPCYLFITADAALFLVPELNAQQASAHIHDPMMTYGDSEGPANALAAGPQRLRGRRRLRARGTRRTQAGEPVLYDLGSRVDGYCSDITRMAFLGEPSARYQQVHRAVEAAVQKALAVIRPGVPIKDVDLAARRTIEEAGFGSNFVHRTGHGIGLSEHEPPSVTHANDLPIEEGMAFSVEPGIYLPGEFGVRLEEIVVVTARGADVLSRLPRDLKVVS